MFQRARGHTIERDLYIRDILNGSSIYSIQSNSSISDPVSRPPHTSNHRGHRQPQSSNWRERPYSNNFNREPNRPFLKPKFNRDVDIHKRHRFVAPPLDGGGRFVPTQEQQSGSRPRPYVIPPRRREIYKYQGRYWNFCDLPCSTRNDKRFLFLARFLDMFERFTSIKFFRFVIGKKFDLLKISIVIAINFMMQLIDRYYFVLLFGSLLSVRTSYI